MRSNQTSKNTSQEELRELMGKSPAAHRFLTLFKTPLDQFVGDIIEVFKAPKAEGVDFEFPTGKRTEFLNLIDPSTIIGNIGPFAFGSTAKGPMVPDDPGPSEPDRVWRHQLSASPALNRACTSRSASPKYLLPHPHAYAYANQRRLTP